MNNMNKLVILMGPPGSGKSSHAKAMEQSGYLRISQDDMGKEHIDIFLSHLGTGRDMVIDRMNFDKNQRDRYRLEAIKNGYEVGFVEFVTPRAVCFNRCMDRDGHPTIHGGSENDPEVRRKSANSALNTFFSRYEEILDEEGETVRIYYNNTVKENAIMVDLDGTLCNLNHRLHFVKEGKKDWGKFFKACGEDSVYEDVRSLIEAEFEAGTEIVLCSGRPEEYREQTELWLSKNEIPYTSLKMRPKINFKSDDITKAMLFRYEIKPFYDVKYVVDDRNSVVNKWRSMGLSCFQVRPGEF